MKKCARELGHKPTSDEFVGWLIARKASIVAESWRQYKASVMFAFEEGITRLEAANHHDRAALRMNVERLVAARDRLDKEPQTGARETTDKTSSMKAKKFPREDREAVITALEASPSKYARDLQDYLRAGVLVGARPEEWRDAEARLGRDGIFELVLQNAKHDEVRAHGPTRTLRWRHISNEDRSAITRWVTRAREAAQAGTFKILMEGLERLLRNTCKALWPRRKKRYAPYSVRHEFAALAKLVYEPEQVAALMGHADDVTATNHYGRYRHSKGSLPPEIAQDLASLPEPHPDEVLRVRRRLADKLARIPGRETAAPTSSV